MIDIKKAEEEFKNYTSNYDMKESHIERKVRHTFRVEEICEKLAILLNMSEEEINLAKLIGLLHDIGRFEQYTKYKTYDDLKSIDHANLGVEILRKDNYIRRYIQTDKYDNIILKAIENHNKYCISKDVNEEERIFCEIIRDADKLDIMYEATCEFWVNDIEEMEKQEIHPKVLEQFMLQQVVDKKYITKNVDINRIIVILAFIYDFYINVSYKIIKENDYINNMMRRFDFKNEETRNQMKLMQEKTNDYIENRIIKK